MNDPSNANSETTPADTERPVTSSDYAAAARKVRDFPQTAGVYLMKDIAGRVIYVGKAKNLRSRAASYFLKAAEVDRRTADLVREIRDIDYLEADSEVDALLLESRLIKDVQPRFNSLLKDDKTFPYLQITTHEDFPRIEFTRSPASKGVKLYGPFPSAGSLRGAIVLLQRIFKFRTCSLDIDKDDPQSLEYEKAARLRDEIKLLERLHERGDLEEHVQPEVFLVDPKKGLAGLEKVLGLSGPPRVIEGVDIAHLAGNETVASLVQFIDGLPFKPGYKRYRIKTVEGIDDFKSIHEVVLRRFSRLLREGASLPDVFLIDGGKGQLSAAMDALNSLGVEPPCILSIAKREEEIFLPGKSEPLRLSRDAYSLRLLEYVRDESHRFAQHYHHLLRGKRTLEDDT